MNEQTIMQDRLAKEIDALLAPYPDSMSRNDFRIACHIGHPHFAVSAPERAGALPPHRQAHPLLQDRQGGCGASRYYRKGHRQSETAAAGKQSGGADVPVPICVH